jgi:hypothetical protein
MYESGSRRARRASRDSSGRAYPDGFDEHFDSDFDEEEPPSERSRSGRRAYPDGFNQHFDSDFDDDDEAPSVATSAPGSPAAGRPTRRGGWHAERHRDFTADDVPPTSSAAASPMVTLPRSAADWNAEAAQPTQPESVALRAQQEADFEAMYAQLRATTETAPRVDVRAPARTGIAPNEATFDDL